MLQGATCSEAEHIFLADTCIQSTYVHYICTYLYMADCTDQETHSALIQTQTPPRKLILLPSLVEQDGLLFSMYIYIYIYAQCGSLQQVGSDTVTLVAAAGSQSP